MKKRSKFELIFLIIILIISIILFAMSIIGIIFNQNDYLFGIFGLIIWIGIFIVIGSELISQTEHTNLPYIGIYLIEIGFLFLIIYLATIISWAWIIAILIFLLIIFTIKKTSEIIKFNKIINSADQYLNQKSNLDIKYNVNSRNNIKQIK